MRLFASYLLVLAVFCSAFGRLETSVINKPNTFESSSVNDIWSFINSKQIDDVLAESKRVHMVATSYHAPRTSASKDDNFRVVVGSGQNSSNHYAYYSTREPKTVIPMIVSTYFQHTASTCELSFRYRIYGTPGSELLVSTQHLEHHALITHENEEDEDSDDWIRPTLRASFKPVRDDHEQWLTARVPIGQMLYPTRVRIECHSVQQQVDPTMLNVECHIDDLDLVNCDEEIWKADTCSSRQTKKYLCHKNGPQKCIDFADVCDMHLECDGGEDEDDALHKCSSVPHGARCDFEMPSETGCPNWRFFPNTTTPKSANNGSQYLQRVSLSETHRLPSHGLPPAEYTYHGSKRTIGHFLFFSTYDLDHQSSSSGEVLYTYAVTPVFPSPPLSTALPESPNYRTCIVRFFYCHTGTSTFQLMLENGADFSHKEVLWTPPKATGSDPCNWQKASAAIPYQESNYRLKLAFGKLYKQPVSVAIDDFSMTPNCFLEADSWAVRNSSDRLEVESCPMVATTNTVMVCHGPPSNRPDGTTISNDKRKWLVPEDGLYHVHLFGGAGGQLPNQKMNNFGGILAANLNLKRNQELAFVAGGAGINPCEAANSREFAMRKLSDLDRLWRIVCSKDPSSSSSDLDLVRRDAQNLFGSSGGGATALYIDNQLVAVAGAGGGLYPEAFIDPQENATDPAGGEFVEADAISRLTRSFAVNWAAGNGASFGVKKNQSMDLPAGCTDCALMTGHPITIRHKTHFMGGHCPSGRHWNISGANGGGGASCGPAAGGGGGYTGGLHGHKTHGQGGSSALLVKGAQFAWEKGANTGAGRLILVRCSLKCPTNSTCAFTKPKPREDVQQFCQCANGKQIHEDDDCESSNVKSFFHNVRRTIRRSPHINYETLLYGSIIIFAILLLIALGFACNYLSYQHHWEKRWPLLGRIKSTLFPRKRRGLTNSQFGDSLEMRTRMRNPGPMERSRSTGAGNLIEDNPIYERLALCELPHISRHFLEIKQSIGHGAFGEVFEGYFHLNNTSIRVAMKSLPIDSGPEAEFDFETEARLLNQFDHENVVKFYGVSFDRLPKHIILEYLEGGDLRNFLRECRPKPDATLKDPQPIMMLDLIQIALDVAHGCEYLEQSKFIHRDISARNCLLTKKGPGRVVKIADFGMARDIFNTEYYRKGGRAFLAVKWMPAESFLDGIFNSKTDVWSYGVLLWEIFSMGYMPYTLRQNHEVMQLVVSGGRLEPPIGVPEFLYDQMLRCWHTDPELRPDFTHLVMFFTMVVNDPKVAQLPLPPILYKHAMRTPGSPTTTHCSFGGGNDDMQTSQTTMSTFMGSSMTDSSANAAVAMPTSGEGIQRGIFPPYQSRLSRPPLINPDGVDRDSSFSSSTHDDSTIHDTGSVKQPLNRLDKEAITEALESRLPSYREARTPNDLLMTLPDASEPATSVPPPTLPPKRLNNSGSRKSSAQDSSPPSRQSPQSSQPARTSAEQQPDEDDDDEVFEEYDDNHDQYSNQQSSPLV